MDYELFQVSAVKAFGHCRDIKAMVSDMQQVLSAVPGMVRKNERLEKEKAELKAENAALKAELDDWKGNAEGFEPDAYMRLPLDADGVPIRLREIVWYKGSDIGIFKDLPLRVAGFAAVPSKEGINVVTQQYPDKAICPKFLTHNPPEPPDSWEKLICDLRRVKGAGNDLMCAYYNQGDGECETCRSNCAYSGEMCGNLMFGDIADRIEKLRESDDH